MYPPGFLAKHCIELETNAPGTKQRDTRFGSTLHASINRRPRPGKTYPKFCVR